MKLLLLSSILVIALAGCYNGANTIANNPVKAAELYDTIPKYDKNTGDVIGDTIISVSAEKKMMLNRQNNDTPFIIQMKKEHIRDSLLPPHKFIPVIQK